MNRRRHMLVAALIACCAFGSAKYIWFVDDAGTTVGGISMLSWAEDHEGWMKHPTWCSGIVLTPADATTTYSLIEDKNAK